jgi:hypothetical protein
MSLLATTILAINFGGGRDGAETMKLATGRAGNGRAEDFNWEIEAPPLEVALCQRLRSSTNGYRHLTSRGSGARNDGLICYGNPHPLRAAP